MPHLDDLILTILVEVSILRYSIHLDVNKIYHDLRQHFWWRRMIWVTMISGKVSKLPVSEV